VGERSVSDDGPLRRALLEANAELLERIEALSLVRLVGDALVGAVDRAAVASALVVLLREELGVDLAALWEVDALGGGLRLLARGRGEPDASAVDATALVPFSAGPLGTVGATGRPVWLPDLDAEAAAGAPPEAAGMRALLLHPVGAGGRTLGVIGLGAARAGGLREEHARLLGLIAPTVALALESATLFARLSGENDALRAEIAARRASARLVGSSPAVRRLLAVVERLADADVTVLVLGESGTGKEVVARALHDGGRRRGGPFVPINCAALPETLLESELFGIERGVATGVERRSGLVERANGGTLFLDEIGDMTPAVQGKVLRVLQEREVTRVGAARPVPVDVRVIAATHRDLEARVREGRFREDLYFRLKVATLHVPSLAERREDIALLADHFLARFATKHGRPPLRLHPDALALLVSRTWPGNVRELENVIEQAVVLADGPVLGVADLGLGARPPEEAGRDGGVALGHALESAERAVLERALAACGQNRTRAARLLGIGRRTLLYKLKRHGLGPGSPG
jgi:DNA-binding NtrC family response regulator